MLLKLYNKIKRQLKNKIKRNLPLAINDAILTKNEERWT